MYVNAQYINGFDKQVACIRCDINGVASFVPIDPANVDYQNIQNLVAEGKLTIAPASS